jgi:NAD(P)-dependent dehydrogenase (short-subunit alcohol dehydrogenase family)
MTFNVLVTGASRGIGKATAILAGARGWNVGVNYLNNKEMAEEIVKTIQSSGGQAVALQGDMSTEQDVLRVFEEVEKTFGPLHGVVVNAGITAPILPLAEMSTERLRKVFDINIFGAYLCAREAARRLPNTPGDADRSIVFVSSAAARLGSPNEYVDYAGSKGAVDTLTLGLSKELGPKHVRVNGVRPGIIITDIHATSGDPGRVERLGNAAPLGRPGTAEEVGETIVFLISTQSSYVTGSIIDVAGGR